MVTRRDHVRGIEDNGTEYVDHIVCGRPSPVQSLMIEMSTAQRSSKDPVELIDRCAGWLVPVGQWTENGGDDLTSLANSRQVRGFDAWGGCEADSIQPDGQVVGYCQPVVFTRRAAPADCVHQIEGASATDQLVAALVAGSVQGYGFHRLVILPANCS